MATDPRTLRIGIVEQASAGWAAALSYTKMLLLSLAGARGESAVGLCVLSRQGELRGAAEKAGVPVIPLPPFEYLPGERAARRLMRLPAKSASLRGEARLRARLGLADTSDVFAAARAHSIRVLLPVLDVPPWPAGVKTVGWIPDFQHAFLPQYFPEEERRRRDDSIRRLAAQATLVLLSSEAARADYVEFAPAHAHKARVLPFPSLFAFDPPAGETSAGENRFNVPVKFALVANQFWAHKNHLLIVEALRRLKESGLSVPVVMTGLLADHRSPSRGYLSGLLQAIASAGLSQQIMILGQVPYADLVYLMRTAAVVIQPSRFEGWSTVVQDAKALGRPLLCSDLAVHREQAPHALGFFPCEGADALAGLLAAHWGALEPGPDLGKESESLAAEREFARRHGQTLLGICLEADRAGEATHNSPAAASLA
jgi:glycosyltransferase involved in cell wall biosynthesis